MYKVLYGFIDTVEEIGYRAGDTFNVGVKTSVERINSLLSAENAIGRPLIEEVEDEPEKEEPTEEVVTNLNEQTIPELKAIADAKGIEYDLKIKKAELIALLGE
jgi:hypothetical protein